MRQFDQWFERYEKERHEEGALTSCKTEMFAAYLKGQASVLQSLEVMSIDNEINRLTKENQQLIDLLHQAVLHLEAGYPHLKEQIIKAITEEK